MHLYLVRHGETHGMAEQRYGDFALNERGQDQARRLAQQLADAPLTHAYSSPLQRAIQTSQIILSGRNVPLTPLEDLCEADIGVFDGLTRAQAQERYPEFFAQSRIHPTVDFAWPGGETLGHVLQRARRAWQWFQIRHGGDDTLLVVSHTFYLNLFLLAVLDQPFPNRFWFKVELGRYVHVEASADLPPWIVFDH